MIFFKYWVHKMCFRNQERNKGSGFIFLRELEILSFSTFWFCFSSFCITDRNSSQSRWGPSASVLGSPALSNDSVNIIYWLENKGLWFGHLSKIIHTQTPTFPRRFLFKKKKKIFLGEEKELGLHRSVLRTLSWLCSGLNPSNQALVKHVQSKYFVCCYFSSFSWPFMTLWNELSWRTEEKIKN